MESHDGDTEVKDEAKPKDLNRSALLRSASVVKMDPRLNGPVRMALATGAAVAAAVVFAWASQSKQDEAIMRNAASIAVIETRLEAIVEKLEEIRALLEKAATETRTHGGGRSERPRGPSPAPRCSRGEQGGKETDG